VIISQCIYSKINKGIVAGIAAPGTAKSISIVNTKSQTGKKFTQKKAAKS